MEASHIYSTQAEQQQQQPTPPPPLAGPDMQHILSLGMEMSIEQLIDHPYAVACVDRWLDDIFVVFENWLTAEFNILRLPRRYHELFTVFLQTIKQSRLISIPRH